MASAQKYMQLLNNPNARRMLDLIASAEGVSHGYNTLFGNQRFDDLSGHPNIRKVFTQTDGKKNYTTAAGRYQFLNDTWNGLSRQYGLRDFSPQSQDIGAIALLDQIGALPYVLKGDFGTAIKKSGGTWASLPSSNYAQNKRSWDFINKQLGSKTNSFEPEFVDLKKVGITPNFKPQMVDLASVGIGAKSEFQPDFVDLKSVGIGG